MWPAGLASCLKIMYSRFKCNALTSSEDVEDVVVAVPKWASSLARAEQPAPATTRTFQYYCYSCSDSTILL
jgi:hypothetical protein